MKHETYEKQYDAMFKRITEISRLNAEIMEISDPTEDSWPRFAEIATNLLSLWSELSALYKFNQFLAQDMIEMKKKLGLPLTSLLPLQDEKQN